MFQNREEESEFSFQNFVREVNSGQRLLMQTCWETCIGEIEASLKVFLRRITSFGINFFVIAEIQNQNGEIIYKILRRLRLNFYDAKRWILGFNKEG